MLLLLLVQNVYPFFLQAEGESSSAPPSKTQVANAWGPSAVQFQETFKIGKISEHKCFQVQVKRT